MTKALTFSILLLVGLPSPQADCFVLPITESESKRTFEWGYMNHSISPVCASGVHDFMVFAVPTGTTIKSYASGTVLSTAYDSLQFGNTLTIQHDSAILSFYGHLDTCLVTSDQKVQCGETVGKSGISGRATAPCLYFKVTKDNSSINPRNYLK